MEFIVLSPQLEYNITRDLFSSANCEVRRANKYSFISIFALIMKLLVQIENIEYQLRKVDRYYKWDMQTIQTVELSLGTAILKHLNGYRPLNLLERITVIIILSTH